MRVRWELLLRVDDRIRRKGGVEGESGEMNVRALSVGNSIHNRHDIDACKYLRWHCTG
jgi:hypothetical protein